MRGSRAVHGVTIVNVHLRCDELTKRSRNRTIDNANMQVALYVG